MSGRPLSSGPDMVGVEVDAMRQSLWRWVVIVAVPFVIGLGALAEERTFTEQPGESIQAVDEDFSPPKYTWHTNAAEHRRWSLVTDRVYMGTHAVRSSPASEWSPSFLWTNARIVEGELSFWCYVSSGRLKVGTGVGDPDGDHSRRVRYLYPAYGQWVRITVQIEPDGWWVGEDGFYIWEYVGSGHAWVDAVTFPFLDGAPDLVVQSLAVEPSTSELGTELTATIVIKNQGDADVTDPFWTDFYEDRATAPGPGDLGDAYGQIDGLAAGATRTFTHTFTPAKVGEKQAWAQVDTDQDISDSPHVRGPVHYVVEPGVDLPDEFKVRRETGDVLTPGEYHGQEFITPEGDLAEWVAVSEPVEPGHVLEIDPTGVGQYRLAQGPCTVSVAGVVSTQPGMILGHTADTEGQALLALLGIVPVKVTDEGGPIAVGDLLIASSIPGYAMRWDPDSGEFCALVGKALEPHEEGECVIEVLLTR